MTDSAAEPKFDAQFPSCPAVLHVVWMLFPSALHTHSCKWAASPFRSMQRRAGKPYLPLLSPSEASVVLNPWEV